MTKVIGLLAGKRILFVGVKFYFYTDAIIDKMRAAGAEVDFFYERDTTIRHGIIDAFFKNYLEKWQEKHYKGIINKIRGKRYDFLFVIRGYKMKPWFIDEIRAMNPGLKAIQYQWDAYRNWDCDYTGLIPYFDRTYTFDYADSKSLKIPYVPTFHIDEFSDLEPATPVYDFFFSGYYNTERYEFIKRLIAYTSSHGYSLKTHLFIDRKRYILEKLHGTSLDNIYLTFKKLTKEDYIGLFRQSKIIVDLPNSVQTGMTMRVIDALGAGKRVITANSHADQEPGYDPSQVIIFDKNAISLPDWITDDRQFTKKDYSIAKWLERVFSED